MNCPECQDYLQVKNTRTKKHATFRTKECRECGHQVKTVEIVTDNDHQYINETGSREEALENLKASLQDKLNEVL